MNNSVEKHHSYIEMVVQTGVKKVLRSARPGESFMELNSKVDALSFSPDLKEKIKCNIENTVVESMVLDIKHILEKSNDDGAYDKFVGYICKFDEYFARYAGQSTLGGYNYLNSRIEDICIEKVKGIDRLNVEQTKDVVSKVNDLIGAWRVYSERDRLKRKPAYVVDLEEKIDCGEPFNMKSYIRQNFNAQNRNLKKQFNPNYKYKNV